MDLQPMTSGTENTYTKIDKTLTLQKNYKNYTSGTVIITVLKASDTNFRQIITPHGETESNELFYTEKKFFQELIKQPGFLEENEGKYIAIKDCVIQGIDSNFSNLIKEVYKNKSNIGKTLIKKITEQEEIIHMDSPVY